VYIGARNEEKAQEVINEIKKEIPDADVHFLKLDLSSLQSVQDAVKEFQGFVVLRAN
jgi:retinol dehydrogenase 12